MANVQAPLRVLFICLGNICRSVAAEAIFRKMVVNAGMAERITVDSAGLIDYHKGELADTRMRKCASERGYILTHRSRPVTANDFRTSDVIVAMDNQNVSGLRRIAPNPEQMNKVVNMADYLTRYADICIPDPYYGDESDFRHVLDLLEDACAGLLSKLGTDSHA